MIIAMDNAPANDKIEELLWTIDAVPEGHRTWDSDIIGYHITTVDNINNIKQNGIKANASQQKYARPECTYIFLDNELSDKNIPVLLGNVDQFAIVSIKIPKEDITKLRFDGLYNISFNFAYGAAMYFDDIPTDYITGIKIYDNKED